MKTKLARILPVGLALLILLTWSVVPAEARMVYWGLEQVLDLPDPPPGGDEELPIKTVLEGDGDATGGELSTPAPDLKDPAKNVSLMSRITGLLTKISGWSLFR